jgi:hypothetical protein
MFVIKFLIYFTISFIILCIPVSQKNIFFYLDKAAAPYTNEIFSTISSKAKLGKQISSKLLNNTDPGVIDSVKSSYSSTLKKNDPVKELGHSHEDGHSHHEEPFTVEEKQMLLKVLKQSN